MKILHYTLFVLSPPVRKYLIRKGVDPDTVYLNDFKFMQRVFHILVLFETNKFLQINIFGYKPSMTLQQFFKYGFAELKMLLCCDTINIVKKAFRDLKI